MSSRLEKTQTIELSRMDAQTTSSSRQGSNSSHASSEHNLIESQPQRPNRRRHRNGEEGAGAGDNSNNSTGDAEFHANNLGGAGPGSRRQNPPNPARIAGQVPEDMGKLFCNQS